MLRQTFLIFQIIQKVLGILKHMTPRFTDIIPHYSHETSKLVLHPFYRTQLSPKVRAKTRRLEKKKKLR